jgi:hypothetical protein
MQRPLQISFKNMPASAVPEAAIRQRVVSRDALSPAAGGGGDTAPGIESGNGFTRNAVVGGAFDAPARW